MALCDRTQPIFVNRSLLKPYLISFLFAIVFLQVELSDAKRSNELFVKQRRFMTSSLARERRQAIVSSPISIAGFPSNANVEREDSVKPVESRRRFCPRRCKCNSGTEVLCTLRSFTTIPQNLPSNLVKLSLAYNKLATLPVNAFAAQSSSLKGLYLQANQLSSVEGAFNSLSQLEILRLSWNKLTAVRKSTFSDLAGLRRLYLDNNRINFFHPEALRGLVNLKLLQLEGNRLSQLHPDSFITLQFSYYFRFSHIRYLYLSNNQLRTIPSTMLSEMAHLQEVYLHGNPWECSCQLQWLHQWMRNSGIYRCKKPVLRRRDPPICALCALPKHLKGQEVAKVSHDNITCTQPHIVDQEMFSSTELFTETPSLIQMQNEAFLFRYSYIRHPSFSLRLDGQAESLALMHCNVTRKPRATLDLAEETYHGHFDQTLECNVEYPTSQQRIKNILEPYLDYPLSLLALPQQELFNGNTSVRYQIQAQDELLAPLRETGIRIESAVLTSDYPIFKNPNVIITLYGNHFYPEQNLISLLFETSFDLRLNEEDGFESRNLPWTRAGSPSPVLIGTKLVLEGTSTVLRCRAMGFPKPFLSWVLPDGTHLRPMNRIHRFKVNRGGRLIIHGASRSDEGVYRCLSQSVATVGQHLRTAADIGSIRLHVIHSETFFPSLVRNINAEDGSSWMHSCNSEGVPEAEVAWITPDNRMLMYDKKQTNNLVIHENKSISIGDVDSQHKGIYRCIVANHVGASEIALHLNVMEINRIDGQTLSTAAHQETTSAPIPATTPDVVHESTRLPEASTVEVFADEVMVSTPYLITSSKASAEATAAPMAATLFFPNTSTSQEETTQQTTTTQNTPSSQTTTFLISKTEQETTIKLKTTTTEKAAAISLSSPTTKQSKTTSTTYAITNTLELVDANVSPTTKAAMQSTTNATTNRSESVTEWSISSQSRPNIQQQKSGTVQPTSNLMYYEEPTTQISVTTKSLNSEGKNEVTSNDESLREDNIDEFSDADIHGETTEKIIELSISNDDIAILDVSETDPNFDEESNNGAILNTTVKNTEETTKHQSLGDNVQTSPSRVPIHILIKDSFDKLVHPQVVAPSSSQPNYGTQVVAQSDDLFDNDRNGAAQLSVPRQRLIRVNFGQSFSIQCPLEERSGLSWEFYPYLSSSRRQNANIFSGVFANDGDIENVVFNGTKEIFITRATSNHNGTFLCRNSAPTFSWTHVVIMATPPHFTKPGFNGVTVEYGNSISIPCAAEGIPKPEISWSWPTVMHDVMMTSRITPTTRVYAQPNDLLRIDEITHDYGMTYVCTARNDFGEVRHPVLVTVSSITPSIQRGRLEKLAREGESTVFDCMANGTPKPKLEWILPSGDIVSLANNTYNHANVLSNGSLVIPLVELTDQGSYGCIATNPIGQSSVEIILSVLPVVNLNLRRDVPSLISKSESHAEIATTTQLTTTTETTTRETTSQTSENTETSHKEDSSDYSHQYATLQKVRHDKTVLLNCRVHFPQESDVLFSRTRRRYPYRYRKSRITAKWITPSGGLAAFPYPIPSWRHRVFMNGTLRITNVRMKDGGIYVCVAQDRQGRKIQTIINLIVVAQAPVMRQTLHQVVEVSKDRAAWAPCSASGYPRPRITWKTPKGRTFSSGSYGTGLRVYSSGKLMLYGVNTNTAGTYTCTASNPGGSITRVVVFKLRTFSPIIRGVQTTTQHVRYGRSARITCTALGVPEPYLYWTMPGGRSIEKNEGVFVAGQSRSKISMLSSGTLVINRAAQSDVGFYHCYATNRMGTATKTVNLKGYY